MLSASIVAQISFRQSGAADFGPQRFDASVRRAIDLASGTGVGQADIVFADQRTVASATNDDLDLAGVLADAFGAAITAVEVVAILLINRSADTDAVANTTSLTLGGATNPVAGLSAPAIGPGGLVLLADPDAGGLVTVTAATGDILRVANGSGAAATYQIVILGRTA